MERKTANFGAKVFKASMSAAIVTEKMRIGKEPVVKFSRRIKNYVKYYRKPLRFLIFPGNYF